MWLAHKKKKALNEALEKIKAELMILGFISLLLVFGQKFITKVCIPVRVADTMLPCLLSADNAAADKLYELEGDHLKPQQGDEHLPKPQQGSEHLPKPQQSNEHHRRLFSYSVMDLSSKRRMLSGGGGGSSCHRGKVPLVSVNGLHQLHIFIFFLAVFHVLDSALIMILGRAKIRGWKQWEEEVESAEHEHANAPQKFRFAHETSFVKQHSSSMNKLKISFIVGSFFRQFFRSVRKADYLAMRHGFVSVHIAPGSKFNFQKYIKRSMEDDFKVIVGISPVLWTSAVLFLLLNVNGWERLLWISIMPLIIILAVGTKLQAIITTMALEISERHAVVQGIPLVQVSDRHFWFGHPHLVLFLIHFTLFQNAFQLIYLLWIGYEFGFNSCFHQNRKLIIARVGLGLGVQFLCSYITLPLYALVSQMGTHMKRSIFDEQTSKAISKWHMAAKKNAKDPTHSPSKSPKTPMGASNTTPTIQLQRIKTTERVPSTRRRKSIEDVTESESSDQHLNIDVNEKDNDFYLVKL